MVALRQFPCNGDGQEKRCYPREYPLPAIKSCSKCCDPHGALLARWARLPCSLGCTVLKRRGEEERNRPFHPHRLKRNFGKLSKITPCFLFAFNALFTQFLCDFSWCFQFTRNTFESCSGSSACGSGCFASMILRVLYSDFCELTFLSTAHLKEEISWILN